MWVDGKSDHPSNSTVAALLRFLEFVGKPLPLQHPLAKARVHLTQVGNRVYLYTVP
jgi:hypothetical protein